LGGHSGKQEEQEEQEEERRRRNQEEREGEQIDMANSGSKSGGSGKNPETGSKPSVRPTSPKPSDGRGGIKRREDGGGGIKRREDGGGDTRKALTSKVSTRPHRRNSQ
jgi:hypothetical protein